MWSRFCDFVFAQFNLELPRTGAELASNWRQALDAWNTYSADWIASWSTHHGGRAVPELDITAGPLAIVIIRGIIAIGLERQRRNIQQ